MFSSTEFDTNIVMKIAEDRNSFKCLGLLYLSFNKKSGSKLICKDQSSSKERLLWYKHLCTRMDISVNQIIRCSTQAYLMLNTQVTIFHNIHQYSLTFQLNLVESCDVYYDRK